jgi:hypothetical protein
MAQKHFHQSKIPYFQLKPVRRYAKLCVIYDTCAAIKKKFFPKFTHGTVGDIVRTQHPVFRIRIQIRKFQDLPDPHPDPYRYFICTAPDPDPSINKQKMKKNLDFYYFVTT